MYIISRRMFPTSEISVSGLDPDASYTLTMEILPVDNKRYKFLKNGWTEVGRVENRPTVCQEYAHPDSPSTGAFWMKKPINFKGIKLTNSKSATKSDQVQ